MPVHAELIETTDGIALILAPELLDHLKVAVGDRLTIERVEDGLLLCSELRAQIRVMKRVAEKNYDVLKRLADS